MALDIEEKVDSPEKLAAIAGKPTKNYLFALEVNKIVQAVDDDSEEEHTVTKIVGNKIFNVDYNEQVIYQQELVLEDAENAFLNLKNGVFYVIKIKLQTSVM